MKICSNKSKTAFWVVIFIAILAATSSAMAFKPDQSEAEPTSREAGYVDFNLRMPEPGKIGDIIPLL